MIVGVIRETFPGERRVALIPAAVTVVAKLGAVVLVESGAGAAAGFPDAEYEAKDARTAGRSEVISRADVLLMVRTPGANPATGAQDAASFRSGQILIGFAEPLTAHEAVSELADRGVS